MWYIKKIVPTVKKANFFFALLLAFGLPLIKPLHTTIIGFWILTWLMEFNFIHRFESLKKNWIILSLTFLFYLMHLFALLYTSNKESGWFSLEVKLTLIIFPIVCMGLNDLYKKYFKYILIAFVAGCFAASLICLGGALYNSLNFIDGQLVFNSMIKSSSGIVSVDQGSYFYYANFSLFLHTSYFSMYLVFSIIICFYLFFQKTIFPKLVKSILSFIIILFLIMLFLLSSRAAFITEIVIFALLYIFHHRHIHKSPLRFAFIIISICMVLMMFINPRFLLLKRDNTLHSFAINKKQEGLPVATKDVSSFSRIVIWKSTLEKAKNNILLGTGPGDVIDELLPLYLNKHIDYAVVHRLNVHNQFLETLLGLGIFALISLLLILLVPMYNNFRKKRFIFLFFLIIIFINFFFETMLNTQAGVIFFAFFYNLFIHVQDAFPLEKVFART